MKKSLALSAFALVMVLPLVSAADTDWNINGGGTVNFATNRNFTIRTAAFPVIPEPEAALPMILGVGGLAVMGRKSRK